MDWRKAHAKNVPGDFYVVDACCTMCEVPFTEAPELFGVHHDERGYDHCFVKKQPSTEPDLRDMFSAIACAELACIRYRGNDPEVLNRLTEMGESAQCDQVADRKWWQFWKGRHTT